MGDIINRILVQVDVVWKNRYLKTFRNFLFSSHDFIALRIIATSEGVWGNEGNLGSPEIWRGEWSCTQDLKKERMSLHMWVEYVYNMYFSVFRFCNRCCLQSWFRQNAKNVQKNLQRSDNLEYRSNHLNNTFSRNRPPLFCIYRKPDGVGGKSHGS